MPRRLHQKRTKNGSTLETKRLVERDWNEEEKIVELRKSEITTTGVKLIHQRQEKKVILVSTVRSLPEYVSMDSQNKLGFLFNSKRFNLGMKTENVQIM